MACRWCALSLSLSRARARFLLGHSLRLSRPQAHTCFYQIDLPIYTEKEQLKRMLEWAADSAGNAYGMA